MPVPWCKRCGETIRQEAGKWVGDKGTFCSEDAALVNFNTAPKGHVPKKVK